MISPVDYNVQAFDWPIYLILVVIGLSLPVILAIFLWIFRGK